jgi:hypothetical protein
LNENGSTAILLARGGDCQPAAGPIPQKSSALVPAGDDSTATVRPVEPSLLGLIARSGRDFRRFRKGHVHCARFGPSKARS